MRPLHLPLASFDDPPDGGQAREGEVGRGVARDEGLKLVNVESRVAVCLLSDALAPDPVRGIGVMHDDAGARLRVAEGAQRVMKLVEGELALPVSRVKRLWE